METMRVAGGMVRALAVIAVAAGPLSAREQVSPAWKVAQGAAEDSAGRLAEGYTTFYNARYDETTAIASTLLAASPDDLEALELRTSALLFRLKAILGDAKNKEKAFKACESCPDMLSLMSTDTLHAQTLARRTLTANPDDEHTRFLLGKIDLNYVWLQLGPLGKRAGWDEYWEARRSLDAVLEKHPGHVRAKVARAWMDYIVDTRVPWGTKWILGGGNRKKALAAAREAAIAAGEPHTRAEARFALWEMELRERNHGEALVIAHDLLRDYPENKDLLKFVAAKP